MPYTIGFCADTHLGYAARCRTSSNGLNMRVRDGYLGFRETITQMIDAGVDLVLHGGDLFHRSHPNITDIAFARRQLERLADAGIPVIGVTGNHDFANDRGKYAATAAVHDPGRNIVMVTDPYQVLTPAAGLNIHAVSHVGLISADRAIPELVNNEVNILISHGAAQVPGHEIFATVDSPGEAVLGYDVLTLPWTVTLLGHYHGMGPLPGFDAGPTGQAWYAGSLLRRGFSDPEGGRGWLKVTIHDDGTTTIERQYIHQRPQHDLPVIDAANLTGTDVEQAILANLATIDVTDAIVRQRVINCPLPVRRGVDSKTITAATSAALVWQLEFRRPEEAAALADSTAVDAAVGSLTTAGSSDLPTMFTGWFTHYADEAQLNADLRPAVAATSVHLLKAASGTEPSDKDTH